MFRMSSPSSNTPLPRHLSFIRRPFSFCSGLSSCLPSIFLSSLSSGDQDYLGSSRHTISPGGKVTHSALQLAPDSCRLKLEVPSILTAALLDSEPLSATQPKAFCGTSNSCTCPPEQTELQLHWRWKKRRSVRVPVVYPSIH